MFSMPIAWANRSIFRVETPVDEGLLDNRDQGLLGSPPLRDEKRHISAFADLGHDKIFMINQKYPE
jgi:hypothetical protein